VFGWIPTGNLWVGAAIMMASIVFITQWERRK
ncbi:MAG: EamA family transporter, partial [Vibrio casei]